MAQLKDLLVTGAVRLLNGMNVLGTSNLNDAVPATTNTYSLGSSDLKWKTIYANDLNVDSVTSGNVNSFNLLPRADLTYNVGSSDLRWASIYSNILRLQGPSSDPSSSDGARIEFTYDSSETQRSKPVYISYTPNDTYQSPYGLKIWDGSASNYTSKNGAWLEVQGSIGISNGDLTSGIGLSLYGKAKNGMPNQGIAYGNTAIFGTMGNVNAANGKAVYFTVDNTDGYGFIFKKADTNINANNASATAKNGGNVASIDTFGSYSSSLSTGTYLAGNKGKAIINSTANAGYNMLARMKSTNGVFTQGTYNHSWQLQYTDDAKITEDTNGITHGISLLNQNGLTELKNLIVDNTNHTNSETAVKKGAVYIYKSESTANPREGQLVVGSVNTDNSSYANTAGGLVSIEMWRGATNASWQLLNNNNILSFNSNYYNGDGQSTAAIQNTYGKTSLKLAADSGAGSIPYLAVNSDFNTDYNLYVEGKIKFYNEGTTASDAPVGIEFANKDKTTGQCSTSTLYFYNDHHPSVAYGNTLVLEPGGSAIIGAGNSASELYSILLNNNTLKNNIASETMYLVSDDDIYFEAGAGVTTSTFPNAIDHRLGMRLDHDGNLIPTKAESVVDITGGTLGSTNSQWYESYIQNKYALYKKAIQAQLYIGIEGKDTTIGQTVFQLGNNLSSTTDANSYGILRMFGSGATYYSDIVATTPTSNRTITLGDYGTDGTLIVTTDSNRNNGTAIKPIYIKDGVATACSYAYAVCSTAAATAQKEVTVLDFSLEAGAFLYVKFTSANTAQNPTLRVKFGSGSGDYRTATPILLKDTSRWDAGDLILFIYDGTNFVGVSGSGGRTYYGTCTTTSSTVAKTVTCSNFELNTGAAINIKFSTNNTSDNPTLNINNTGAKDIYKYGQKITSTNNNLNAWRAEEILTVVYDGTNYIIVTPGEINTDWVKSSYLRVNSTDTNTSTEAIINGNVVIGKGEPMFTATGSVITLTSSNKSTYFDIVDDPSYSWNFNSSDNTSTEAIINGNVVIGKGEPMFTATGSVTTLTSSNKSTYFDIVDDPSYSWNFNSSDNTWTNSNNGTGYTNTTCKTVWTAKNNCILTLTGTKNAYSTDYFYVYKNGNTSTPFYSKYTSSTNDPLSIVINLKAGETVEFRFNRGSSTSTTYTHSATFGLTYQTASVAEKYTTLRDVTSFTNDTESTSATTGAVKISGGVGIQKNLFTNGEVHFTQDSFSIQDDIMPSTSTVTSLNNSNIETYFIITNGTKTFVNTSGDIWNNDNTANTNTTSELSLTAKNNCVLTISGTQNGYNSYFYIYKNGSQITYFYGSNNITKTLLYLKIGDIVKITYQRGSSTSTSYTFIANVNLGYQAAIVNKRVFIQQPLRVNSSSEFSDIMPKSNLSYTLGRDDLKWSSVYTNSIDAEWLTGKYLRINSSDMATSKNAIIAGNIDLGNGEPLFTTTGSVITLSDSTKLTYFNITDDTYSWDFNVSDNTWTNNNQNNTNTTVKTTWEAKNNCVLVITGNRNAYSTDYFYVYINGTQKYSLSGSYTTQAINYTAKLKAGDKMEIRFVRSSNTSASYTHTATIGITYQAASISETFTYLKDASSITNDTESTSTTTGALKVTGGVGIGKSLYIGDKITATGEVSFTNGILKTKKIITSSNSVTNLTSSNASSYFTITNTDATPWTYTSDRWTNGNYNAASGDENTIIFKAKQNCLLTIGFTYHKASSEYLYVYQNGTNIYSNSSSGTSGSATATISNNTAYQVFNGDEIKIVFKRYGTDSTYQHKVFLTLGYQQGTLSTQTLITSSVAATSKTTGALVVSGGAGFGGKVYGDFVLPVYSNPPSGAVTGQIWIS